MCSCVRFLTHRLRRCVSHMTSHRNIRYKLLGTFSSQRALKLPPSRLLISALLISALCSFPCGYQGPVVNIPQSTLEQFVNETVYKNYNRVLDAYELSALWSFIVNIFYIGGILGAWATMFFADWYGRRLSLLVINNVIAIIGSVLMGCSKSEESLKLLTFGRFIVGFNSGLACGLLGLFLTECSPNQYRGFTGSLINLFFTISTLVAQILALPDFLGTSESWPLLLSVSAIPALVQLLIFWVFPESPKHLLLASKNEKEARKSVEFYHGETDVESVLDTFRREKAMSKDQLTLKEALSDRDFFWPIFVSVIINIAQIASGITAIFTYSTSIFQSVGVSKSMAPYASTVTSLFNLVGAFIALPLMERCGRRPLMLWGLITCLVCDVIFVMASICQQNGIAQTLSSYLCLIVIMIHVTVFNIGPGPIALFVSSESTPHSVRSIAASLSITVNWLAAFVIGLVYLPLEKFAGPWSFLLFIIPTAACVTFLWLEMPETKNKSIEEIMRTWRRKRKRGIIDYLNEGYVDDADKEQLNVDD